MFLSYSGLGLAVLVIGLAFRVVASLVSVLGLGLNKKEKIFIPFAWLPKATVQAAIGSQALDIARQKNPVDETEEKNGLIVSSSCKMSFFIQKQ